MNYANKKLGSLRKSEIILGFVLWFMFVLGTQIIVAIVLGILGYDVSSTKGLERLNFWNSLINFIAALIIFRRFLWSQAKVLWKNLAEVIGTVFLGFFLYLAVSIAMNLITQYLIKLTGIDYYNANQEAVESLMHGNFSAGILVALISAPLVEECLNRALVFGLIHRKNRILAYLVSMLIFSAIHVIGAAFTQSPIISLISLLVYFAPGFVLAWAYERTGTIWASILLHLGINSLAVLAILIPDMEKLIG